MTTGWKLRGREGETRLRDARLRESCTALLATWDF